MSEVKQCGPSFQDTVLDKSIARALAHRDADMKWNAESKKDVIASRLKQTIVQACQGIFVELDMHEDKPDVQARRDECMHDFVLGWNRALRECTSTRVKKKANHDQLLSLVCSGYCDVAIAHPLRLIGYAKANRSHHIAGALSETMPLVACHALCLFFNVPIVKAKRAKIAAVERAVIEQFMPSQDRLRLILQDMPILDECDQVLTADQLWALKQLATPDDVYSHDKDASDADSKLVQNTMATTIPTIITAAPITTATSIITTKPTTTTTTRTESKLVTKTIATITQTMTPTSTARAIDPSNGCQVSGKFYLDAKWRARAEAAVNDLFPEVVLSDTPLFSASERKRAFQQCRALTLEDVKILGLGDADAITKALQLLFRIDRFDNVISIYAKHTAPCGCEGDHWWPRARLGRSVAGNCLVMHTKVNAIKRARIPMFLERESTRHMSVARFAQCLGEYGIAAMLGILPADLKDNKRVHDAVCLIHLAWKHAWGMDR